MIKTYIGSIVWRTLEPAHVKALVPLLREEGFSYWPMTGDALVERARSISATHFLRHSDADVHLSIDSDIVGFTVEDTKRICEQAMTSDIVAGVYVCRSAIRTFPATFYEDGVRVLHGFDHTPVPVKWAATGFMAVHRRVFERLAQDLRLLHPNDGDRSFYPFYLPFEYEMEDGEPILLSEDYAFCERAKRAGFGCYVNPAVRLGHVGQYIYRLEDTAQPQVDPQPIALTRQGKRWRIEGMAEKVTGEGSPKLLVPRLAIKGG